MSTTPLPISRDGRFRVVSREWDCNGSATVDVLDNIGDLLPLHEGGSVPAATLRAARRTARRSDPHPGDVRWTRFEGVHMLGPGQVGYRFTVSRLSPEYR